MGYCTCLMGWGPVDLTHVTLRGPWKGRCVSGIWDEGPPGGKQGGRGDQVGTLPCERGQMQQLGSERRGA